MQVRLMGNVPKGLILKESSHDILTIFTHVNLFTHLIIFDITFSQVGLISSSNSTQEGFSLNKAHQHAVSRFNLRCLANNFLYNVFFLFVYPPRYYTKINRQQNIARILMEFLHKSFSCL